MTIIDLQPEEYNEYYATYINKVPTDRSLLNALRSGMNETSSFFSQIPDEKIDFRYAEGKWTPKEVLLHLIDTERIFSYRALRFARKDKASLPGFEQDDFVANSKANERAMSSLVNEYKSVREATISLFEHLDAEMLKNLGQGSGINFSPRALGFINAGHEIHHRQLIQDRYL